MPCPLTQTWDAAIAVRDAVYRVPDFKVFIIPVLLLTDTPLNRHSSGPSHRGMDDAAPGQGQVPLGCQQFPGLRRIRLCTSR